MNEGERRVALQQTLYDSANPTRRYLHRARRAWVEARLRDRSGDSALELGPGSGVYLPLLASLSAHAVALDLDPDLLRSARDYAVSPHAPAASFVTADMRAAPFAAQSFDLILCSEVIEHVPNSQAVINAIASLLKADGCVILTTPQPYSLLELLGKIAFLPGMIQLLRRVYGEPVEPTGHINVLGRRALEVQIAQAGLRIAERATCGFYLPLIAEFGGQRGAQCLQWLDQRLQHSRLRALLWTQCYVLKHRKQPHKGLNKVSAV